MQPPRVTVLMPVYNAQRYLHAALDSVLRQTFTDFELLVINDGSTDDTAALIEGRRDRRVRLVHNERNLGVTETLNRGLRLARGDYIARMDADDLCAPERIGAQVEFLDAHPEIGLCGAWFTFMGTDTTIRHPQDHESICVKLLSDTAFAHPTVMLRRALFLAQGLFYDASYQHAEDYELWSRVTRVTRTANLGRVLLSYRLHDDQVSAQHAAKQSEATDRVRINQLQRLGLRPERTERELHLDLVAGRGTGCRLGAFPWLAKLYGANAEAAVYDERLFARELARWWGRCSRDRAQGVVRLLERTVNRSSH